MTESEAYLIIILSYFLGVVLIIVVHDLIRKKIESDERKSLGGNIEYLEDSFSDDLKRYLGSKVRGARWISIKPVNESRDKKEESKEDLDA